MPCSEAFSGLGNRHAKCQLSDAGLDPIARRQRTLVGVEDSEQVVQLLFARSVSVFRTPRLAACTSIITEGGTVHRLGHMTFGVSCEKVLQYIVCSFACLCARGAGEERKEGVRLASASPGRHREKSHQTPLSPVCGPGSVSRREKICLLGFVRSCRRVETVYRVWRRSSKEHRIYHRAAMQRTLLCVQSRWRRPEDGRREGITRKLWSGLDRCFPRTPTLKPRVCARAPPIPFAGGCAVQ